MDILLSLPAAYINPLTLEMETLLDISALSIESTYNGQQFDIEWSQNNTFLALNSAAYEGAWLNHESKINADGELNDDQTNENAYNRKKKSIDDGENIYFNRYIQKVVKNDQIDSTSSNSLYQAVSTNLHNGNTLSTNDRILAHLPSNRTIYFGCRDIKHEFCLEAKFRVSNIKASNLPILITVNFTMDMTKVAKIMTNQKDILVVRTSVDLIKTLDDTT